MRSTRRGPWRAATWRSCAARTICDRRRAAARARGKDRRDVVEDPEPKLAARCEVRAGDRGGRRPGARAPLGRSVIGDARRLALAGKIVGTSLKILSRTSPRDAKYAPGTVECVDLALVP